MKKRTVIILCVIIALAIIVGGISLFWYCRRSQQYETFKTDIVSAADANRFDKSIYKEMGYMFEDGDSYVYSITLPGYLSMTGNLSVAAPMTKDTEYSDSLIIWVEGWFETEYEYGLLLEEVHGIQYQIYIDKNGNALDPSDEEILENHRESIQILFDKANAMWGFDMGMN